ncbi:transcription termination factor, mitochondrial isoform X2 [Anabrus simplex]
MIKKCPNLLEVPLSKLCYNAEYFKTLGLRKRTLVSYPWILAFSGASTQSHRLNCVQKLHSDINVTAPLLQMPLLRLQKLCSVAKEETHLIPGGNRINYLSQRLHCEPVEICQTAAKHPFILAVSFDHLESVLSLLADAGVAPQHILKDTWVFRYNIFTIESRLNQAKEAGIKKIKPWVVRCPQATLDRTVEKHVSSRELLGSHPSVVSYLCHRLECSAEMLEFLSCKAPQMLKVNVPKLKEVLDFLYQEGFTPQQVCQVPRVLNHSLRTLQTRLKQLRSLDYNPNSLIVLCQTKRQYRIFVEKLISVRQKCAQSTS